MATVESASLIFGLISGIITAVDATKKVYDAAKDAAGLPAAFRAVANRLPTVRVTLEKVDKRKGRTPEEANALIRALESCKAKATDLEAIFKKVLPGEGADRLERYYKALRTIGKGKSVESIFTGILQDLQVLGVNAIEDVLEAIEEMRTVEPSVPPEPSTYNNYGSGPQNVKNGVGDLNSNSGSGNQFIGPGMTFAAGAFGKKSD